MEFIEFPVFGLNNLKLSAQTQCFFFLILSSHFAAPKTLLSGIATLFTFPSTTPYALRPRYHSQTQIS